MQTTTYKLNVTPGGVPLTIHISQYDVGLRQYTFQPYTSVGEFTYVSGATVTLEATKPDGYAVIHECTYNQDGSITYTIQEQLAAKPGRVWSKVVIRNGDDILGTGAIVWMVDSAGVKDNAIISDSDISALQQWVDDVQDYAEQADGSAQSASSSASLAESAATQAAGYVDQAVILGGTPLVAATVSAMSDHDRVYVYTGSETGYTAGNWYYWNGSAWTSGGIYNSSAVQTDPTLSISGMAADAAATGELKTDIREIEDNSGDLLTTSSVVWEQGSIGTTGNNGNSTKRLRTKGYIAVRHTKVVFTITTGYRFAAVWYNSSQTFLRDDYWITTNTIITPPEGAAYLRLVVGLADDSGTATSAYANQIRAVGLTGLNLDVDKMDVRTNALGAYGDYLSHDVLGQVKMSTPEGTIAYTSGSAALIKKYKNVYSVNGELAQPDNRFPLTGTKLSYKTYQPTYANEPDWYVAPIADFVVGHDYMFIIELVSGSYVANEPYITPKNRTDSLAAKTNGGIWTCEEVPEMVTVVFKPGTYSNAYFYVDIVDITAKAEADGNNYYVPAFFETQLNTAIDKINADLNGTKVAGTYGTDMESFVYITDVHWDANKKHSPGLIKSVLSHTPVKTVVCGGDFVQSYAASKANAAHEIQDFTSRITGIPCYEYYAVFGNHDDNTTSNTDISIQFTKQEVYNLIYAPFSYRANVHWIWDDVPEVITDDSPIIKADYYVDHPLTMTRYLCVDWDSPITSMRENWIKSVLAKNDGYRVVIFYHGIYSASSGELEPEHTGIMTVIAPYKNKVVALFTGHAHMDAVVDYYGDGSVPVILTNCDTFRSDRMTAGTVDEQCFDVAVIDYGNSVIKLTRIGRGNDRQVSISLP